MKIAKSQVTGLNQIEADLNSTVDLGIENRTLINALQYTQDSITDIKYKIIIENGAIGIREL